MFARRFSYLVFAAAGAIVLGFLASNVRAQEIGDLKSSMGSVTANASETSAPIPNRFFGSERSGRRAATAKIPRAEIRLVPAVTLRVHAL
jgi:hypothetical protein